MKIFCIGLSKTGTNSLCEALRLLGFDIIHYPGPDFLDKIDDVDGVADLPACRFYKDLHIKYPDAKFILTSRDESSWLKSIEKHYTRRPPSTLSQWGKENRMEIFDTMHFHEEILSISKRKYEREVLTHFQGNPNFIHLPMEMMDEFGWKMLTRLTGRARPKVDFPHANSAPERTQTVDVVYPYREIGSSQDELRYSVRSVEENFLDLRKVFVVGDQPKWMVNYEGIKTVQQPNPNFDYCYNILAACLDPRVSEEFLCINDDHYILTPCSAQDVKSRHLVLENLDNHTNAARHTGTSSWQKMVWNTYDRTKQFTSSGWSHENHAPVMVNKRNLLHCFALLGIADGNLAWKTAYFSMFPWSDRATLISESGMRAGFYGKEGETWDKIADAVYLNHNDVGLSPELLSFIHQRFSVCSRFERKA